MGSVNYLLIKRDRQYKLWRVDPGIDASDLRAFLKMRENAGLSAVDHFNHIPSHWRASDNPE
jgi:hypothetical protein